MGKKKSRPQHEQNKNPPKPNDITPGLCLIKEARYQEISVEIEEDQPEKIQTQVGKRKKRMVHFLARIMVLVLEKQGQQEKTNPGQHVEADNGYP